MPTLEKPYLTPCDLMELHYGPEDHLGSTRVVIDGEAPEIGSQSFTAQEQTFYYSYGKMHEFGIAPVNTREKFTGKEFDQEGGIDAFHFGARMYDPEVGVWMAMDPGLQMRSQFYSTYAYLTNGPNGGMNPICAIDPDGRWGAITHTAVSGYDEAMVDYVNQFSETVLYDLYPIFSEDEIRWANNAHKYVKSNGYFSAVGADGRPIQKDNFSDYLRALHDDGMPDEYINHLISDYDNQGEGQKSREMHIRLTFEQRVSLHYKGWDRVAELQDADVSFLTSLIKPTGPIGYHRQVTFLRKEQARLKHEAGLMSERRYVSERRKANWSMAGVTIAFILDPAGTTFRYFYVNVLRILNGKK
jgi:RHS repeat-associated protein